MGGIASVGVACRDYRLGCLGAEACLRRDVELVGVMRQSGSEKGVWRRAVIEGGRSTQRLTSFEIALHHHGQHHISHFQLQLSRANNRPPTSKAPLKKTFLHFHLRRMPPKTRPTIALKTTLQCLPML